jgi:outer membrane protein OmpA-like peptidoglycan-associated protein
VEENPVTVEQINTIAQGMEEEVVNEVVEEEELIEEVTPEEELFPEDAEEEVVEEVVVAEEVIEEEVTIEPREGYHYLYFNTVKKDSYKEVKGRVLLIDPVRAKELTTAQSHEIVEVKNPNNGQDLIKASTKIFGFKEVQHLVNLADPLTDSTEAYVDVVGDSVILNFELERFKKGDVLIMYNVYFYKDASIMKPESKYELLSLLDMLQENEKLEVRIHGHTNSNAKGKIIYLDHENPDFFNMKSAKKESFGSAKELSLERAKTIEAWLVQQGVDDERMTVKGWGGKKMIYDKHDTQAHKNVRVEIEIVDE